jgi:DNA helicase-2/ATP-dependent DNA helicase PcrA
MKRAVLLTKYQVTFIDRSFAGGGIKNQNSSGFGLGNAFERLRGGFGNDNSPKEKTFVSTILNNTKPERNGTYAFSKFCSQRYCAIASG